MENKTQMGLLLLIIGMVLGIFSTLGGVAAGSLGSSSLSPGALIPGILGFFGFILLLIGWILMLVGRKDFGEKHAQFVIYSLVAIIIGVIIAIVGGIISAIGAIAGGFGNVDPETSIDYAAMARGIRSGLIFSSIGGIIITIGAVLLVYCLENELGKKVLFIALIVTIIVSIVTVIYLYSALEELADRLEKTPEDEQEDEFVEGFSEMNWINSLGIIGSLLLIIGFFIPYNRIKKGELKPIAPPPPAYGMPPYPAPYPYQPYPPHRPPYQQPYQPPYPPQQPQGYPEEIKTKPPEETAEQKSSSDEVVQPKAVIPEQVGIMKCMFCGTQIPEGSTTCPVCKKELL